MYVQEDLLPRFHYVNNRRITPVLAMADLGWTITSRGLFKNYTGPHGTHGYDNIQPNMQAIFMAA